jgi:hypothetical protein
MCVCLLCRHMHYLSIWSVDRLGIDLEEMVVKVSSQLPDFIVAHQSCLGSIPCKWLQLPSGKLT